MIRPIDIVVLGSKGCGKSSLVTRFCDGIKSASTETLHDKVHFTRTNSPAGDDKIVSILDTAHDDFVPGIRQSHIKSSRGIILVYSICNLDSYLSVDGFYNAVCRARDRLPPFVLIGTNLDRSACRAVSYDEGLQLASRLGADLFLECSAKSNDQVMNAVEPLVKYLTARAQNRNSMAQSLDAHPGYTIPDLKLLAESLVIRGAPSPVVTPSKFLTTNRWGSKYKRIQQIRLLKPMKRWVDSASKWMRTIISTKR